MAAKITCPTCGYSTTSRTQALAEYGQRRHSCQVHLERAARRNKAARMRQQRPVRDCQCKQARHQHGTYVAYTIDRCRCEPCTRAAARYERERELRILDGKAAYVDTAPALAHIKKLQAAGLGWKRIAHLAGVSNAVVYPILYGRPDRNDGAPRTKARVSTIAAILAVPLPDLDQLGSRVPVPAVGTRRRLQALACLGWSMTQIADRAGLTDRQPLDKAMHDDVTGAATARAIRDVYDQLWDQPPPRATTRGAASAVARVRNHAKRNGWAPPLAWDDETIDNPDATPYTDDEARGGVDLDEFMWLLRNGEAPDRAAHRLGVTLDAVTARARRTDRPDVLAAITASKETAA